MLTYLTGGDAWALRAHCYPLVGADPRGRRRPSKPWGPVPGLLSARAALWKAGGPPVPSPRWVAGPALTFPALQRALQQELPRREFFLPELLREM